MTDAPPQLDSATVQAFVANAHGGDDWETDLDAAAHMGRRDNARLRLESCARHEHARAGGDEARGVLELLEAVAV